jgi:hypothetical protein
MTNTFIAATVTATVSLATVLAAQQPSTSRAKAGESVTITGCVAETTGHYMLTQAMLVKPAPVRTPVAAGATGTTAQKPRADDQTYELIGAQVKAHAGHRVQVTGTMPSAGSDGNAPASADPARTAHPIAGTVTVKSLKMLSKTCP